MVEFDRQDSLKEHFNGFWSGILSRSGICNDDIDLYDCMTLADFIELKRALSEINNIITLKLTLRGAEYLRDNGIISDSQYDELLADIMKAKPSTNGYDIAFQSGNTRIIAEIKANIPCSAPKAGRQEQRLFGAAQIASLIKDIKGLSLSGKKNRAQKGFETGPRQMFLFVLECGDAAIRQLVKRSESEGCAVKPLIDDSDYDPDYHGVNIVRLSLNC